MPRNFNIKGMLPATSAAWKEPQVLVRMGLGLLLAANLVAAAIAFNLFGASPQALNESLIAANARLQADQNRLNRSRVLASNIGKGKTESDTFLASYFTSRRTTFSTILSEVNDVAKGAGLKTEEGTIAPLDPIEGSDDLSMMTFSVNVEGTFPQFVKFINMIDRSPRFLIIESMQMTPQPKGDLITSNLKLHVFVKDDTGGVL